MRQRDTSRRKGTELICLRSPAPSSNQLSFWRHRGELTRGSTWAGRVNRLATVSGRGSGERTLAQVRVASPAPLSRRSTIARVAEFVPPDFDVPLGLETSEFVLEPLGPEHNELDYDA